MRSSATQGAGQPNGYGIDGFSQPRGQSTAKTQDVECLAAMKKLPDSVGTFYSP
jgi:hypothetical protein